MSPVFGLSMDQSARNSIRCLAVVVVVAMISGCGLRRHQTPKCCPTYQSQRVAFQVAEKSSAATVETDFGAVGDLQMIQRSPLQSKIQTTKIDLGEAICLAATNSELADLIEAERHALNCAATDGSSSSLDLLLQGESLEQRNTAAGIAGKLLLRLVEVNLQRTLLGETQAHLDQLADTIEAADDEGFTTAEGENALVEGRSKFQLSQSELKEAERKLTCQLNQLINIDSDNLIEFQPVYDLAPTDLRLDAESEIVAAKTNRPGVRAMESALASGLGTKSAQEILAQFDSRLGLAQTKPSIKQRLLRRQLRQLLDSESAVDSSASTRREQFTRILEGRRKRAQTEARMALIKIQSAIENVAIANSTVERLTIKSDLLQAKQELDSSDSFLATNQNWIELQTAKSDRISAAIEHDTAILELLQSQGGLVQQCGFDLPATILPNLAVGQSYPVVSCSKSN